MPFSETISGYDSQDLLKYLLASAILPFTVLINQISGIAGKTMVTTGVINDTDAICCFF